MVPMVRGFGYIVDDLRPDWPVAVMDVGPSIPYLPLWAVGLAWAVLGVFMLSTLWFWRGFKLATALAVGAYVTWSILYVVDLFLSPDVVSITSLAGYMAMVPAIITLVGIEIDRDSERVMDPTVPTQDTISNPAVGS